ncbi:unnamed protein product [Coffea canephora]|uniref:Uncharacterized protein n=1 Tax=Coffea canephora TaxID=49390 RepID=A0A068TYI5_COFCA|nr:unnamed protein product [Coffea canephora]
MLIAHPSLFPSSFTPITHHFFLIFSSSSYKTFSLYSYLSPFLHLYLFIYHRLFSSEVLTVDLQLNLLLFV